MNDPYSDFGYTEEEITLLVKHDMGEELHAFVPPFDPDVTPQCCVECGDDSSGLMHNNTWRNVEPLMEVY